MTGRVLVNTVSLSSGALTRERHLLRELVRDGDTSAADCGIEYRVLCTPETAERLPDSPELAVETTNHPDGTAGRLFWENTSLLRAVRRYSADALYFPLHITNLVDLCPKVAAVRNAAPYYPEAHRGASRRELARLRALRAATRRTVRQSDRVVFMSEATRDRVAASVPAAREKGVVAPHGVPAGFEPIEPSPAVLESYDLPEKFLLTVSNIARYKNFVELVDGYAAARTETDLPPLCIAGRVVDERYATAVRRRIRAHELDDSVRLLGYVDHDDLPHLHAASELFVFGSACENAPVSLVEALACGDAIASSNAASMPEICGDAATYFDPYDPTDISETLVALWENPGRRERLGNRALARVERFDWDRTADRIANLFVDLVR
jgi:glycosyltransferase involved in cell wall biosynthesis